MKSCFTKFNYPHDDGTSSGFNLCRMLMVLMVMIGVSMSTASAQSISGLTFFDGNNDGALGANELIFPHVTVNVYNASGVLAGSAVSGNDGMYSVSGLTSGTSYRVEFVAPAGYKDASYGTNSSTSVRFVTAPASNIDFGVYVANQCAPGATMPRMVAGCMPYNGDYTSLISFNYNDRWTTPNPGTTAHTGDNHSGNVGVPAGFTVRKSQSQVLFSTLAAENTSLFPTPPDGNSAIYIADYSGGGFTYQSYKLLVKLSNLGIDVTNQYPIAAGVNNIGEFGLGGIAISEDERYIYVVNAGKRNIVRLDISGVTYASIPAGGYTTTAQLPMVEIAIPDATTSCSNGYFRPYALEYRAGKLYVGGICDASSSGSNAGLTAKVFEMDPVSNTFTQRFTHDLTTFNVSDLVGTNLPQVKWKHPFAAPAGDGNSGEMQPLFYDIAFDDYGAIIINVLNRRVFTNSSNREAGYVVRTWRQADGSFVLESDRISGPLVSAADIVDQNCQTGNRYNDISGPGTISGPKWFLENGLGAYSTLPGLEYTINAHHALANGGVYCLPGTNELVAGFTDPLCTGTAGVRYFNTTNGKTNYGAVFTEAKIFAITGTEGVCAPVPLEIGNRVWNDTDGDGIQDPGENPIANVSLEIFADFDNNDSPDGAALGTATTDANGEWYFNSTNITDGDPGVSGNQAGIQPRKRYMVRVASSDWSAGIGAGDLTGLSLTTSNAGGAGQPDVRDNDASLIGSIPTIAVTTGNAGENDHSLDMGFRVFSCTNPSAITTSQVPPTCTGATPNNNGTISLTAVTNGTHYGVSTLNAGSYDGPAFASATAIPALPAVIKSSVPNTGGSYIVRIFNGDNACFTDVTVTVAAVTCSSGSGGCSGNLLPNSSVENGTFFGSTVNDGNATPITTVATTYGGSNAIFIPNSSAPTEGHPIAGFMVNTGYWVDGSTNGGSGSKVDNRLLVIHSGTGSSRCIWPGGMGFMHTIGTCYRIGFWAAQFDPANMNTASSINFEVENQYGTNVAGGTLANFSISPSATDVADPNFQTYSFSLPASGTTALTIGGAPYTGSGVVDWKTLNWQYISFDFTPALNDPPLNIYVSTNSMSEGVALDGFCITACGASCVNPSAITTSQVPPTCTGATPNNNGTISLTAVTNGTHYGVSTLNAGSYDGPAFASATAIPALPAVIKSSVPNTGGSYIVRIFNGDNACFTDVTVTVAAVSCAVSCALQPSSVTLSGIGFGPGSAPQPETVTINGGGSLLPESNVAGFFFSSSSEGALYAFCSDITQPVLPLQNPYTHEYNGAANGFTSTVALRIAQVIQASNFNATTGFGAGSNTVVNFVALQLAVWNAIYDMDYSVSTGTFHSTTNNNGALATANAWLTTAQTITAPTVAVHNLHHVSGQDLLMVGNPPSAITISVTAPTCVGAGAPNNGALTVMGFTNQRYQYSTGVAFNAGSAIPAVITSIPAGGVIVNNLANTSQNYTVRIYDATDDNCYIDLVVSITAATCACTQPSAITTSQVPATCTGMSANNNGTASLVTVTSGTHFGVSTLNAGSYDGPAFASATALPGTLPTVVKTAIPNSGGTYIVRIFNGDAACFTDQTITASTVNCSCAPICGTTTVVKN